jgi:hypothetical protein
LGLEAQELLASVLPLHYYRPLTALDGAGSADHVPDAAQCGPSILVDGGLHIGGGWLSLAGSPLHDHHDTFAVCWGLHTHHLVVNRPFVVEEVSGLVLNVLMRKEQFLTNSHCRCSNMAALLLLWFYFC